MARCHRPPRPVAICSQFAHFPQNTGNLVHLLTQSWYFPKNESPNSPHVKIIKNASSLQRFYIMMLPSFMVGSSENCRRGRKSRGRQGHGACQHSKETSIFMVQHKVLAMAVASSSCGIASLKSDQNDTHSDKCSV